MDYEKKYNHALEVVRELQKDWASTQNRAAREIELAFPELRESEDELIRKEMLDVLNRIPSDCQYAIFFTDSQKQRYISYLEKQKQKQTDLPAGFYYIDLNGNRYYSKEFRYGDMKLKVGEQKPAEKQDYSGLTDLERAIHRGFLVAGVENVPVTIIKETAQDCLAHMPAWSEEDELMCNNILNLLCSQITYVAGQGTTSGKQYPTYSKERDWFINRFKSLRPSWKPSEEDKRILKGIIGKIDHDQTYGVSKVEMLNFLKRLQS